MCDRWSNRYIFPTSVQTAGVGGYLSPGDSRIVRLFLFECHMHPVPQVTECPTNPNFSQMSVSAGWPCLWVLAFCAGCWRSALGAVVLYNREKNESLIFTPHLVHTSCLQ